MVSIFKQEKGAEALKKLQGGPSVSSKAKVVGGAKAKKGNAKSASKSGDIKKMVEKINKFTPGAGKPSVTDKKSTTRILTRPGKTPGTLPSPGGDREAGTTDHQTMKDFKKMVAWI